MSYTEELNNEICRLKRINLLLDRIQAPEDDLYSRNEKLIKELELILDASMRPKRSKLKLVINN